MLNLPAKQHYYVKKIIPATREVVLGGADSVFTDTVYVDNINYMAVEKLENIPLQEGVYIQLTGPNYESPSEVRMCRTLGADAVGIPVLLYVSKG